MSTGNGNDEWESGRERDSGVDVGGENGLGDSDDSTDARANNFDVVGAPLDDESDDEEDIKYALSDFSEDILLRLKQNDPKVVGLDVCFGDPQFHEKLTHTIDWPRDGSAIADNTHLRSLRVDGGSSSKKDSKDNITAFFRAVSRNRSIKELCVDGQYWGRVQYHNSLAVQHKFELDRSIQL